MDYMDLDFHCPRKSVKRNSHSQPLIWQIVDLLENFDGQITVDFRPLINVSCWRYHMELFSALLAICAGNSPAIGEFPAQRPVTRSFNVFFDLCLNKRSSKQWWGWCFDTPSRSLWRHFNVTAICPELRALSNFKETVFLLFIFYNWNWSSTCSWMYTLPQLLRNCGYEYCMQWNVPFIILIYFSLWPKYDQIATVFTIPMRLLHNQRSQRAVQPHEYYRSVYIRYIWVAVVND